MLKNLKNMIIGWWKALVKAIDNWLQEHCKKACSVCYTPTLLKDLKTFNRPGRILQVCPDCCSHPKELNKILYKCDKCNNVFKDGSLTEYKDSLLCRTCLNERTFYCPECHTRVSWIRKFVTQSTVTICKPCAEKFQLHKTTFSGETKAVLEKCHREAIRMQQLRREKENLCRTQSNTDSRVCARCRKSIDSAEEVFFEPSQKTYCKLCAAELGVIDHYVNTVSSCDGCGKKVSVDLLSNFNNSFLCRKCLDKYSLVCPICRKRIAAGNSFHSTYLLEYCNPCGKKFGLTRYIPPEEPEKIKKKSSGRKGRKKKSESSESLQARLISSSEDFSPGLSDAQVWSMMSGGKKTSWESIFSEPTPPSSPNPAFSPNNYYHPEFDDNEEDDFVLDGIGGLDGKHDI